jgi:hypothetical protein
MEPVTLTSLLYYVAPVVLTIVANRFGIKLPGQPEFKFPLPSPVPGTNPIPGPTPPVADKEAVAFLNWLMSVKAGSIKLDSLDLEALRLIKAGLADVEKL